MSVLYKYRRTVATVPFVRDPQTCILGHNADQLKLDLGHTLKRMDVRASPLPLDFQGKSTVVKAPALDRLREFLGKLTNCASGALSFLLPQQQLSRIVEAHDARPCSLQRHHLQCGSSYAGLAAMSQWWRISTMRSILGHLHRR